MQATDSEMAVPLRRHAPFESRLCEVDVVEVAEPNLQDEGIDAAVNRSWAFKPLGD